MSTRKERNDFYTKVGKAVEPGKAGMAKLSKVNVKFSPNDVIKSVNL